MNLSSQEILHKKRERTNNAIALFGDNNKAPKREIDNENNDYSKLFENNECTHKFFGGIWKLDLLNNYFNFPFQLQKIHKESRTQTPICFVLKYTDDSNIFFYIQIENDLSCPQEMTPNNTIIIEQSSGNSIGEGVKNSYVKPEKDYTITVEISIIGFNYSKFSLSINSGEGTWVKTNFPKEILTSVKSSSNAGKKLTILFDISIDKTNHYILSKKTIPFCGLVNEGTTCYMNSLLQLLYMLKYFKKAIFNMKIQKKKYKTSKIYSLQKLFYDMIVSSGKVQLPVQTTHLITSFGWNREQILIQRDIQEFFIVLSEIIENEMKNLKEKNTFKFLFEGKITSLIKCLNVNFESSKEETFTDIQLPVKNCKDIYESFDKYTEEEILKGSEQYQTDKYGKQDAKKELIFSSLPKVLVLQLNRFKYNTQTNEMEKINDRFEFYNELNLGKYTNHYGNIYSEYECFGVVVHIGRINGGHYYSYIKNFSDSLWYKFNDESVTIVEEYEVFDNNFGGESIIYKKVNDGEVFQSKKENNLSAYLLFHIRKDCINEIMGDFSKDEIPKETLELFDFEEKELEKQKLIEYRKKNFVNVSIITREILEQQDNIGIIQNYHSTKDNLRDCMKLNVHKDITISSLIETISDVIGISKNNLFLYKYTMKKKCSYIDRYNYIGKYIARDSYRNKVRDIFTLDIEETKNQSFMNYQNGVLKSNLEEKINNEFDECYLYIHCDINKEILIRNDLMDDSISGIMNNEDDSKSVDSSNSEVEEKYEIRSNSTSTHNYIDNNEVSTDNNEKYNNFIYFNHQTNYWCLKKRKNTYFNHSETGTKEYDDKHYILLILKYPSIGYIPSTNQVDVNLNIYNVLQIEANEALSNRLSKNDIKNRLNELFDNKYNKFIIPYIQKSDVEYLIEYSSLEHYFKIPSNNSLDFKSNFKVKGSQNLELYKNDVLNIIINLNFKDTIKLLNANTEFDSFRSLIDNKYNDFFLKLKSNFVNKDRQINLNKENGINEVKLVISMQLKEIKEKIVSLISEDLIWKLFSNGSQIYRNIKYNYCDIGENTNIIHEIIHLFKEHNNYDIIELVKCDIGGCVAFPTTYPLLEYINTSKNNEIEFVINLQHLISPAQGIPLMDYTIFEIILCDTYSNPLIKLFIPLSYRKNEHNIAEINKKIVKYLDEIKSLYNFYPNNMNCEFFFVLHNPKTFIAYDIEKVDSLKTLENYKCLTLKEFRYQPYIKHENMRSEFKIFFCVYEKDDPICFPFVLHFDSKSIKVGEFKLEVIKYLLRNKEIQKKFNTDKEPAYYKKKFRFYKCKLENYKPTQLKYLSPQIDDNILFPYKGDKAFNIKIEIVSDGKDINSKKENNIMRNSMGIIESYN